jgi:hypothetical protein
MIYLVHGFNVKDDGADTIDTIRTHLENADLNVTDVDYGWFQLMRVHMCNKSIAKVMSTLVEPGSTCIAHSNGAALAYLACEFGAPFKNVILVNPALDSNKALAAQVENVQVWFSPGDTWAGIARFIPNSIWGAQGRKGYTGPEDSRYVQFNEDELLGRFKDEHSGIWNTTRRREYFADKVATLVKA